MLNATKLTALQDRSKRSDPWGDEGDDPAAPPSRTWTREEALALRASQPPLNPWRVIAAQAALGVLLAALMGLYFGRQDVAWSALYGAATVVVPGALMARGMTRRFAGMSPGVSAVSVMSWSMVKIGVSVVMLMLAPGLVQPLSWPALLATLVLCMQMYWLALLWRGR